MSKFTSWFSDLLAHMGLELMTLGLGVPGFTDRASQAPPACGSNLHFPDD